MSDSVKASYPKLFGWLYIGAKVTTIHIFVIPFGGWDLATIYSCRVWFVGTVVTATEHTYTNCHLAIDVFKPLKSTTRKLLCVFTHRCCRSRRNAMIQLNDTKTAFKSVPIIYLSKEFSAQTAYNNNNNNHQHCYYNMSMDSHYNGLVHVDNYLSHIGFEYVIANSIEFDGGNLHSGQI